MRIKEVVHIILCYIFAAAFIALFFFTYVSSVESQMIKDQINSIIDDISTQCGVVMTPLEKQQIGDIIQQNLVVPDMSKDDADAAASNDALIKKSEIVFGVIIGVGIIIVFTLWYIYRFSLLEVLKFSSIILALIVATEFAFTTFIVKNYVLVDPNYVKFLMIQNLKQYAQS